MRNEKTWRGRAAAATEHRAMESREVDQDLDSGLRISTTLLQVPEIASAPPAKRRKPEGKSSRGGRKAEAGSVRGMDSDVCDQEQEWEGTKVERQKRRWMQRKRTRRKSDRARGDQIRISIARQEREKRWFGRH